MTRRPRLAPIDDLHGTPDTALRELLDQSEAPASDHAARAVEALLRLPMTPKERLFCEAFLEGGCSTVADVERLLGWAAGYAYTLRRRILDRVRKARERAA